MSTNGLFRTLGVQLGGKKKRKKKVCVCVGVTFGCIITVALMLSKRNQLKMDSLLHALCILSCREKLITS